jgi:hypothetical protein
MDPVTEGRPPVDGPAPPLAWPVVRFHAERPLHRPRRQRAGAPVRWERLRVFAECRAMPPRRFPPPWSVEGRGERKAPGPTGAKQKNLRIRRVLFDAVGSPLVIAGGYHAWRAARREGTD